MSLGKRHMGRRVAGVGVGVALMVLGLEAPAMAVLGPITFAPASGPDDCLIVITGTDFEGPDVDVVEVGGAAASFEIQSDTEIWAAAPGTSGFVTVEKTATAESVSSTSQFTDTTGGGGCAPTIASFTPTCGTVGTVVNITGTNLIEGGFAGALTEFSPFTGAPPTDGIDATHTGVSEDPTSLSVLVPTGAADGPIAVTTDVSQAFSATDFDVVTDVANCVPATGNEHARTISLKMKKNGRASGVVSSTEDPAFTDCVASVPVKLKYKKKGKPWKNAGRTSTTLEGNYALKTKGKPGKYKAIAVKVNLGDPVTDVCLKARSPIRKIKK